MLDLEFKCNFCEKIYKLKNSLVSHKNKKHKQERLKERLEEKIQKKNNKLKTKIQKNIEEIKKEEIKEQEIKEEEIKEQEIKKEEIKEQEIKEEEIKEQEIKEEEIKEQEIKEEEIKEEEIKEEQIKEEEIKQQEINLIYDFNSENDREKLLFKLDVKTKLKFLKENHSNQIIKLFELIHNNNNYYEFRNIILKGNNNLYFYKNNNYNFYLYDNNEKLLNQIVENYHWNINEIYCEFLTNKKDNLKNKKIVDFIDDQQSIREGLFYSKNVYINNDIEYKSFIEYNKIKIFDFLKKKYL
jgi:hypothetical protein